MSVDPRLLPVLEADAVRPRPELPVLEARAWASAARGRLRHAYYRPGPEPETGYYELLAGVMRAAYAARRRSMLSGGVA